MLDSYIYYFGAVPKAYWNHSGIVSSSSLRDFYYNITVSKENFIIIVVIIFIVHTLQCFILDRNIRNIRFLSGNTKLLADRLNYIYNLYDQVFNRLEDLRCSKIVKFRVVLGNLYMLVCQ